MSIISIAISNQRAINFLYNDEVRSVEPHALGVTPKGDAVMRGWQTTGEKPGWRLFTVDKIEREIFERGPGFTPRPGYKMGDAAMATITAQVQL